MKLEVKAIDGGLCLALENVTVMKGVIRSIPALHAKMTRLRNCLLECAVVLVKLYIGGPLERR